MRRTMLAVVSAAAVLAGATFAHAQEAAGAAAGATTGAVTGAIVGGPVGAVVGGAAGAAIGAGAASEGPRDRVYVAPGAPSVERTCVEDSVGNQRCREVVR